MLENWSMAGMSEEFILRVDRYVPGARILTL